MEGDAWTQGHDLGLPIRGGRNSRGRNSGHLRDRLLRVGESRGSVPLQTDKQREHEPTSTRTPSIRVVCRCAHCSGYLFFEVLFDGALK